MKKYVDWDKIEEKTVSAEEACECIRSKLQSFIEGNKYMSIWKKIDLNPEEIIEDYAMKMSKQHYEMIADTLACHAREFRELEHEGLYDRLVGAFVYTLLKTNPAFDRDKFIERCGE